MQPYEKFHETRDNNFEVRLFERDALHGCSICWKLLVTPGRCCERRR